jgi:glycerol-3-phosphate acyltransferase PlsX
MGAAYMERVGKISKPRVGLVNIGVEENKGLALHMDANKLLKAAPVNFIGNVEAREIPLGGCDVAVCDGFVGNVVLKLTEGMGKWFSDELKTMLLSGGIMNKLAALILKNNIQTFRAKTDYTEHGGAPLLGIAKPVIKAHGSSNAKAIKNAIRQAKNMCDGQVIEQIEQALSQLTQNPEPISEGSNVDA